MENEKLTYLIMWRSADTYWRTYTTDSLKSAILVYKFKKNIYDTVEFYQKGDVGFDFIIRGGTKHER